MRSTEFSADRTRKQAARRQRRRRELVKQGLARFTIAADCDRLAAYLLDTGRISEAEALSHGAVERALGVLVTDIVDRFAEVPTDLWRPRSPQI